GVYRGKSFDKFASVVLVVCIVANRLRDATEFRITCVDNPGVNVADLVELQFMAFEILENLFLAAQSKYKVLKPDCAKELFAAEIVNLFPVFSFQCYFANIVHAQIDSQ